MVDIISVDNGSGGTSAANNREYNGGIMGDGSVVAGTPGPVSTPAKGAETGNYPAGTVTPFHSHPSGTVTSGGMTPDPFGGQNTMSSSTTTTPYRQSPSGHDISNSGSCVRYVFARGNDTVYIYNNQGVRATIPTAQFVNPKK